MIKHNVINIYTFIVEHLKLEELLRIEKNCPECLDAYYIRNGKSFKSSSDKILDDILRIIGESNK